MRGGKEIEPGPLFFFLIFLIFISAILVALFSVRTNFSVAHSAAAGTSASLE